MGRVIDTEEFLSNFRENPEVYKVLNEICEHTPTSKGYEIVVQRVDVLEKRLKHLLQSNWIRSFDEKRDGSYTRDITQADLDAESLRRMNLYLHDIVQRLGEILIPIRIQKTDKLDRHGKREYSPCNISKHDVYRKLMEVKLILTESDIRYIYERLYNEIN